MQRTTPHSASHAHPCLHACMPTPRPQVGTYLDQYDPRLSYIPEGDTNDGCTPAPILAVIYFCSYIVIVALLLLQVTTGPRCLLLCIPRWH